MNIKRAFVTGASGFIGSRLVKRLTDQGVKVTCLLRKSSKIDAIDIGNCQTIYGDLANDNLSLDEIGKCDAVFHVAALTSASSAKDLVSINPLITRNLFKALAATDQRPPVVLISSLAAAGVSAADYPLVESSPLRPVSHYGQSKLAAEKVANEYANEFPITVIRPPIVLGQGDEKGLEMFRLIQATGWHFVPGFRTRHYSVVHVDDLVLSMIELAEQGRRATIKEPSRGVYFASQLELSYADLGRQIGTALGRTRTHCLYVARPVMWAVGASNSLLSRLTGKPRYLNMDKYREAFAGNWTCSGQKLSQHTDFKFEFTFEQRLQQTVDWYRNKGWLNASKDDHQHLQAV